MEAARSWWIGNRDHVGLFADEIDGAIRLLSRLPGVGTVYDEAGSTGTLRRLFLRRLDSHLYYSFDDREVVVRALWGARKGQPPGLDG